MKYNRPLLPKFLKSFDQQLLVKQPAIWTARTHLVIYYGLLFIVVLALLSFLDNTDLRAPSPVEYWVGFTIIICIVALTVWIIFLLRFNVFKRYGEIKPWHLITSFLLYFIATGTIILFPYVYPAVETIKANNKYSTHEIASDINVLNLNINKLEYNALDHTWKKDTIVIVDSLEGFRETANRRQMSRATFMATFTRRDSLVTINDTMHLHFTPPPYVIVNAYRANGSAGENLLSSRDIYDSIIRNYQAPADKAALEAATNNLAAKYIYDTTRLAYDYTYSNEGSSTSYGTVRNKYRVYRIEEGLNNIFARKERFADNFLASNVRLFYHFTLFISLLILTFRFSTRKTFFLGLLTIVILSILTALIMAMMGSQIGFFSVMIFYTLLFLVISFAAWKNRSRHVVTGIAGNLFVYATPLLPSFILQLYIASKQKSLSPEEYMSWYQSIANYPYYAEVAGGLLLLILLATYLQRFYRRWYALPEG